MKTWQVVECQRCGHVWDDDDPEAEVCACILNYGQRTVRILSQGATNQGAYELFDVRAVSPAVAAPLPGGDR